MKNNITKMQNSLNACNCKLRPHIKTHKSIEIAKLQIEAGASGITCAKISEAKIMADGGIDDIFVAYPLVGYKKIKQAIEVHKKIKRLILAVDSLPCAKSMAELAKQEGVLLEVRLEIDTGSKRTGVLQENVVDLCKEILKLKNLNLTGIYTFKSMMYKGEFTKDVELAGQEEGELMNNIALKLRSIGANIIDISAGSTPTGLACAKTGLVTEVRPGTYVFHDYMTMLEGACEFSDIAAYIYATVVSVPSKSYAIIDGGTKTFPADVILNSSPFNFSGYAYVTGREDLILNRLNEEHGIITSTKDDVNLNVSDIIALTPTHICTSINLQNYVYLLEDNKVRKILVDARGALN